MWAGGSQPGVHGSCDTGAQQTRAVPREQPPGVAAAVGRGPGTRSCSRRCRGWGQFTQQGWADAAAASERRRGITSACFCPLLGCAWCCLCLPLLWDYCRAVIPPSHPRESKKLCLLALPGVCWVGTDGCPLCPVKGTLLLWASSRMHECFSTSGASHQGFLCDSIIICTEIFSLFWSFSSLPTSAAI